ncbi:FGGY-family carbohydrate kinase [Nocardiopsis baichengensis]|uniref:FGGY-family carbohydrate kinase n=1 Tax=Nocardiopsis baichengensis TaxID=280240 RepID=UPI0003478BEF|nr:FGGY family carbohydrate kinase [Nocardiopsis baichengensis]
MADPSAPLWVGIDVGTQGVRAVAALDDGTVAGQGAAPLRGTRRDGRHEQDPEHWWEAVGAACRTAMEQAGAGRPVGGAALCATSGTVLAADRALRPLGPALMYDDGRAAAAAEDLIAAAGEEAWRRVGARPQPSWAFARLALLGRRALRPGRGDLLLHQADFLTGRLNGAPTAADTSHALKSGADPLTAAWPDPVVEAMGVPPAALPALTAPGRPVGTVCARAAAHTALPQGTPIVAGMTDGCAAQLASGALEPGRWNAVLGTTLVLKGTSEQRISDGASGVYSHRSPDGKWWPGGASSTGAGVLTSAFPGTDPASMDAVADLDRPASAVVYPLAGHGERFPFAAPQARGFTLGAPTDEADRYAATLQGVAFVERLCFERLAELGAPVSGPVRVTGGAVAGARWTQLRADVLGRALEVPENTAPAFGMALLAACGGGPPERVAARMVRIRATVEPRPEVGERLEGAYRRLVEELAERGWTDAPAGAGARRGLR